MKIWSVYICQNKHPKDLFQTPWSQISQSGKCKKSVFNFIAVVGHIFPGIIMSHFQICPWPCERFVDEHFRIGHLWDISELYFPPQGHNKAVDWWALGILIYEMLAGELSPQNCLVLGRTPLFLCLPCKTKQTSLF